jgi:hypothetical protein
MSNEYDESKAFLDMDERTLAERIAQPPALDLAALAAACEGHTPGPWNAMPYHNGATVILSDCRVAADEAGRSLLIADVAQGTQFVGEGKANATLLAAAPALLAHAQAQAARIAELEAALKWLEFAVRDDVRDYEQMGQLSQALPAAWAVLGDADPDARTLGAIAAMGEALVSARADAAEAEAEP